MLSILTKVFGTANDRIIKKLRKEVEKINDLEATIQKLSDKELQDKTSEFKKQLENGKSLDDITYEAFAVVREAAKRVIGQRHYDVQLIGGLILHRGMITEMRTGEGKTLVGTLPTYLNALTGKGVHVVTVNDYLASRDSAWMGQIFEFLGLTVGCVVGEMDDDQRKAAYNADITNVTNNELGFDYLRDNMKFTQEQKVQRPFNFVIIDEVDSILIDEARTPLIISGAIDASTELHAKISLLVAKLSKDHYEIDEKAKSVTLKEEGINVMESMMLQNQMIKEGSSLYDFDNLSLVHYINQALKAHYIFNKDVDYLVKDGKVMIIDEFTGRVKEGSRYSDGLHQAIEAKESVTIQRENQTLASITFQNYFRMYPKLSGMTGTAMTEAAELKEIYNLDVVSVPTHNKVTRIDEDDVIYGTKSEKYNALIQLIKDCHEKGQPVLVGTISIEKSEEISSELAKSNIKHNVLNAKMHEREAQVIAQAGRYKAVTIATNMAGRGTDIMLGGNPEMMIEELDPKLTGKKRDDAISAINETVKKEKEQVMQAGGLYVIATERHESRRIDNQLRGRAGRQGDPGFTKFFLSLEDDLMRIFASDKISGLLRNLGLKDGEAIHHPMISRSLETAQKRVESHHYEIRKNLLKFDDVMNDQRKIVYNQRNEIIDSEQMDEFVTSMIEDVCEKLVNMYIPEGAYREDWAVEELHSEASRILNLPITKEQIQNIEGAEQEVQDLLYKSAMDIYNNKTKQYGDKMMNSAAQYLLITTLDQVWKDHLHSLDYLRQGISLRAYGQKDPLNEYKREAFGLFENMLGNLRELFVQRISLIQIDTQHTDAASMALDNQELQDMEQSRVDPAFEKYNAGSVVETKARPLAARVNPGDRDPANPESWGRVSRNEACPCESGKKYKHCHGAIS